MPLRVLEIAVGSLAFLLMLSIISAVTASNTTPASRAYHTAFPITPDDLKPSACAAIAVDTLTTADDTPGAIINGGAHNDLLIGSPENQNILGGGGDDCIVGGGGNDMIHGGQGTDVCIGSTEASFRHCETVITRPI